MSIDKIIGIVIGIIVICLIGAWGIGKVNSMKDTGDTAMSFAQGMTTSLEESKFEDYTGTGLGGNDVVSAFKTFQKENVCIIVDNGSSAAVAYGMPISTSDGIVGTIEANEEGEYATSANGKLSNGKTYSGTIESIKDGLSKITNQAIESKYVNPGASFKGELIRSETTDAIIGIAFIKE